MNATGRSGIPKVVGILMIIFGSLGLIGSLIGLMGNAASSPGMREIPAMKTWATLSLVFGIVGLGVSALHLFAGIKCVGYKAAAPKLAVMYGIINILNNLVQAIIVFAWLKPALSKFPGASEALGAMLTIGIILSIIWPTIVLALMTRPAAKAACTN